MKNRYVVVLTLECFNEVSRSLFYQTVNEFVFSTNPLDAIELAQKNVAKKVTKGTHIVHSRLEHIEVQY